MYFAGLSENFMPVCDKKFHFVFNLSSANTSSDFLQKLQMSGEVFSPPEPSRAKFTSGRVFRLSRPLAWTLVLIEMNVNISNELNFSDVY